MRMSPVRRLRSTRSSPPWDRSPTRPWMLGPAPNGVLRDDVVDPAASPPVRAITGLWPVIAHTWFAPGSLDVAATLLGRLAALLRSPGRLGPSSRTVDMERLADPLGEPLL